MRASSRTLGRSSPGLRSSLITPRTSWVASCSRRLTVLFRESQKRMGSIRIVTGLVRGPLRLGCDLRSRVWRREYVRAGVFLVVVGVQPSANIYENLHPLLYPRFGDPRFRAGSLVNQDRRHPRAECNIEHAGG